MLKLSIRIVTVTALTMVAAVAGSAQKAEAWQGASIGFGDKYHSLTYGTCYYDCSASDCDCWVVVE